MKYFTPNHRAGATTHVPTDGGDAPELPTPTHPRVWQLGGAIRQLIIRSNNHWIGDVIGAACLFIGLFALLVIGELFR